MIMSLYLLCILHYDGLTSHVTSHVGLAIFSLHNTVQNVDVVPLCMKPASNISLKGLNCIGDPT